MENKPAEIQAQLDAIAKVERDIREYKSYDTAEAYRKVERRMAGSATQRFQWRRICLVAASLLLLLIPTSILSYLYIKQYIEDGRTYLSVEAAPGVVTQFKLPDGSGVWLNAGSTLHYPVRFSGRERKVVLNGEGYFDVESNKEKPFVVSLQEQLEVKAYGTQFNIKSYPDEPMIETTLEEGNIEWICRDHAVRLHPGEIVCYNRAEKKTTVSKVQVAEKISWINGILIFRRNSLEDVTRTLSRRFNVDIVLHKGKGTYPDFNFRATFTTETITQILDYMKMAAPIRWSFADAEQQKDYSFTRQRIDIWLN